MNRFFYLLLFLSPNLYANPWHCVCYDEIVEDQVKTVTNCRPTSEECTELSDKILVGTKQIISNSLKKSCTQVNATYPWDQLGGEWQASKKAGSWQYLNGCLLKDQNHTETKLNPEISQLQTENPNQSLFLVSNDKQVSIHTFENKLKSFDFKGEAYYSHDLELLWLVRENTNDLDVFVVDFRADSLVEIPILANVPKNTTIQIHFRSHSFNIRLYETAVGGDLFLKLNWHKNVNFEISKFTEDGEVILKSTATKMLGKAWFEAQINRVKKNTTTGTNAPKQKHGSCENEGVCGKAKYFPKAPHIIYISSQSCGDFCHISCQLIDKTTSNIKEMKNCGPYFFSKDQQYYGNDHSICDLNNHCKKVNGKVIGVFKSELQIDL